MSYISLFPRFTRKLARKIGRRWLAWRFRHYNPDREPEREARVAGLRLRVLPEVFNPALHFTSAFFVRYLQRDGVVTPQARVLDIGTGSGALAIAAARAGAASVTAIDINAAAVECAAFNVRRYRLGNRIAVLEGDMFGPVAGRRFDLVVCNPPYLRGEPTSRAGYAYWGGKELDWLVRFGRDLYNHLAPGGSCILSIGDAADVRSIVTILQECGWHIEEAARRDIILEVIYLLRLTRRSGGPV